MEMVKSGGLKRFG